jgi:hypothetical protein
MKGGKVWKFTCYSVLCMASINSYHNHKLTSNSSGEFLELNFMYCDLVPILMEHTTQISYIVDVISRSYTSTKNVLHMLNWR